MNVLYVSCPSEPFSVTLSYDSFDVFGIRSVFFVRFSTGRTAHAVIPKDLAARLRMKLTVEKGRDTLSGGGDQDCVSFPSMFPPSTIFLTF